jgi:hypothetical protein
VNFRLIIGDVTAAAVLGFLREVVHRTPASVFKRAVAA